MKKVLSLFLVFTLLIALPILAFADNDKPLLVDNAGLLSSGEFTSLSEKLKQMSYDLNFDIVVVTVNSLDGKTPQDYADDFYDYNGYGFGSEHDGCLFLISMEDRDWYISTTGYGIRAITDYGISYIENEVVPYLSDGRYYDAFITYANIVEDYLNESRSGTPYDIDNIIDDYNPNERSSGEKIKTGAICVIAAIVIALVVSLSIRHSYTKAVHFSRDASNYLVQGSLNMTGSYDNFLYSNVTKVRIQSESSSSGGGGSSTHVSSSGTSHGGGGGKF